jgi:hypothetical protein
LSKWTEITCANGFIAEKSFLARVVIVGSIAPVPRSNYRIAHVREAFAGEGGTSVLDCAEIIFAYFSFSNATTTRSNGQ